MALLLLFPCLFCNAWRAAVVLDYTISMPRPVLLLSILRYRRMCVPVAAVDKFCLRSCCCHRFRPFLWTIGLVLYLSTVFHRCQAFIIYIWCNLSFSDFRGLLSISVNVEETQNQSYNTLCINYLRKFIFSFDAIAACKQCIILESPIRCNTLMEPVVTECGSLFRSWLCIHEWLEHQHQYSLCSVCTFLVSRNRLTQHFKPENTTFRSNDIRNNILYPGLVVEELNQVLKL